MTAVLVSQTLCKRFGPSEPWSLFGFDLELEPGRVLALLGPVGAGKTTFVRLVGGLLEPDEGELLLFGGPAWTEEARARIGLVTETPEFPPMLKPAEVMDYCGRLLGLDAEERAARSSESLQWAGLDEEWRECGRLTAGRKKRLGIAQALLGSPDLLVLDEPQSGLDMSERLALRQLVRALARGGSAILICSSELNDVVESADDVVLLEAGRTVGSGPLRQVLPSGWSLARVFAERRESRRLAEQVGAAGHSAEMELGVEVGAGS